MTQCTLLSRGANAKSIHSRITYLVFVVIDKIGFVIRHGFKELVDIKSQAIESVKEQRCRRRRQWIYRQPRPNGSVLMVRFGFRLADVR